MAPRGIASSTYQGHCLLLGLESKGGKVLKTERFLGKFRIIRGSDYGAGKRCGPGGYSTPPERMSGAKNREGNPQSLHSRERHQERCGIGRKVAETGSATGTTRLTFTSRRELETGQG